ncbi:glycoside hydrolase family 18 protein [Sphingobacterium psychroaquaticum]|uniref:glycoside hydrolase family 18 protein n=1 Tax=Sphingobacterium psychroaquaticum TaxID=561061 RepID=UPI00106D5B1C|nr:glycoside hydrolase family 18 protein [Sphingobacterium psychroaquaticum]QBQ40121.1 glycoside hydrolase family 18 protein [Sphingobacterium psychroaquaticum]
MNTHKRLLKLIFLLPFLLWALLPGSLFAKTKDKVIVAYVTSWTSVIPDPAYVTHINYAFGHVNKTFDGIRVDNEARLRDVILLKKKHPHLKVLLSIGGWGSGGFSEMAADPGRRGQFAADCLRVVELFGLDGIDIDWEYPTSNAAGISYAAEDTDNFTLLMKDIRTAIGVEKLLTLATAANGKYIAFASINPFVDFVNIMTYDSGNPPFHHASLFRSDKSGGVTCEEAIAAHVAAGMPIEKLVLGLPFYGRGNKTDVKTFIDYRDILQLEGLERKWDDVAKADYMVNKGGDFVLTFETPESIRLKCEYLLQRNMKGAMYWEYAGDTNDGILRKTVFEGVFGK